MKKLLVVIMFVFLAGFISGCATPAEIIKAENEPICWGNIIAKSTETNHKDGRNIMRSPLWPLGLGFISLNTIINSLAATINPDCYSKSPNTLVPISQEPRDKNNPSNSAKKLNVTP